MISAMKRKAAELGADGIILAGINEPSAGAKIASEALLFATENYHEPVMVDLKL